jgi:hypothetical protein
MYAVRDVDNVNSDYLVNQSENIETGSQHHSEAITERKRKNRTNAKRNLEDEDEEGKMMCKKKFPVGKLGHTLRLRAVEVFRTRGAGNCYAQSARRPVLQPRRKERKSDTAFRPKLSHHLPWGNV